MSDNKAKAWFSTFVLVVFCLGGVLGFRLGTHWPYGRDPDRSGIGYEGRRGGPGPGGRRGGPGRGEGPPPALPPDMLNQLTREMQLDAPQQEQLKKILEERRDRLEQVHRDARERFDTEQRELQAAIRGVLRADQQQAFEQFLERRPGRGRRGSGGGPTGPVR